MNFSEADVIMTTLKQCYSIASTQQHSQYSAAQCW